MNNKQLLNRLIKAQWVCLDCGNKYGKVKGDSNISTFHNNICDVCRKRDMVTESRDYGYLYKGRQELQKLVIEDQKSRLKPKVRVKVKKVVQTNLKNLKKELRKVTHAIVRHGATQCYICGNADKLSAGHFWSDGGHSNTRYDFNNLRPCCNNCNMWKHGNLAEYSIKLRKELGEVAFENLYKRAHEHKIWKREELEELLKERKIMLKELTDSDTNGGVII